MMHQSPTPTTPSTETTWITPGSLHMRFRSGRICQGLLLCHRFASSMTVVWLVSTPNKYSNA
jgi:hypothetical protein